MKMTLATFQPLMSASNAKAELNIAAGAQPPYAGGFMWPETQGP
jgi:hypothetical protein